MAKLTKALFAAAKKRLGIKKVTKKNIGRIAKAAMKGSGSKTAKTTSLKGSNPKKGGKSMKGKSLVVTATQLAKVGGILAPAVIAAVSPGDISHKVRLWLSYMSGIDISRTGTAKFRAERLLVGWGPVTGVSVASKVHSKINGLIRRI